VTTKADREPTAADFAEPISARHRTMDFAVLVGGVLIIVFSVCVGGAALLLVPLGIAAIGIALWLLSREKRSLPPPKPAETFGDLMAERIGHGASTPEGRSHYIHEYVRGVQELNHLAQEICVCPAAACPAATRAATRLSCTSASHTAQRL
jgi:hypothetical protein